MVQRACTEGVSGPGQETHADQWNVYLHDVQGIPTAQSEQLITHGGWGEASDVRAFASQARGPEFTYLSPL